MIDLLENLLGELSGTEYGELRFHDRIFNQIAIRKGDVESAKSDRYSGIGVRVLYKGSWGFSSTNRTEKESAKKAILDARKAAEAASRTKKKRVSLAPTKLARGRFGPEITDSVRDHSFDEKLEIVRGAENRARKNSDLIVSAFCRYEEILDRKVIVTTDGARVEIFDEKPDFLIFVIAADGTEFVESHESRGVTGGFNHLFSDHSREDLVDKVTERATKLLRAPYPEGGKATVILDPALVGIISHEAIGHTVEADFVLSGAITKGKIGKTVASELITMVDSGKDEFNDNAVGTLLVDDEGVITEKTVIIDHGILKSYLHNRESAAKFGVPSTGNARAWEYDNEPIIRMRNTYITPGETECAELIAGVEKGYLLKDLGLGGQADANAEFMFSVKEAYRIEKGKIGELIRGVTVSGQAFDVLRSVDGVSKDFQWEKGAGHCGKGQPAKVDAGGPYIRCKAIVGGRQKGKHRSAERSSP